MALVEALDASMVMSVFRCATFASADEFLTALATKQGKFAKGGAPNTVSAARTLIRQWNEGLIPHYTAPPQLDEQEGRKVAGEGQEAGLGALFRVANEAMVAELREREQSGSDDRKYIVLEESLFADDEAGDEDDDEEEDNGEEEEEEEEERSEHMDAADEEQDEEEEEDVQMDEQADEEEEEAEQAVDEEVFIQPSPIRTRNSRQQRSPGLSINTQLAAAKQTKQQRQPLLTPSRTQQRNERRKPVEERKEAEVEQKADRDAMEAEDEEAEEVVSEPDSPAKNTRSHRQKAAAATAPPIAAVTTPRRSARAKSSAMDQPVKDTVSTVRTRARRK